MPATKNPPHIRPQHAIDSCEKYTRILTTVIPRKPRTKTSEAQGGKEQVSNILLKVENAGAERLWNYILAYRRMMGAHRVDEQSSSKNNIILGLMPTPEQAKTIAKPKRCVKKHL
jgi:hypothetical protein